jgi:predicted GNAT family acetyltransferase
MSQNEPAITEDLHALRTLSVYYGLQFGCSDADLWRPSWTIIPTGPQFDPAALLYGRRPVLRLLAPVAPVGSEPRRAGLAALAPELRAEVVPLLRRHAPEALFTRDGLAELAQAVLTCVPQLIGHPAESHHRVRYTTRTAFQPYVGQWQEWIEQLDESRETDLAALSLLARYSGGVYVIRQRGAIVAYAGIYPHSPHLAEVVAHTEAEALRGHGLARAVAARATKAVLAAGRLPLASYAVADRAADRLAESLGYRMYADALTTHAPST